MWLSHLRRAEGGPTTEFRNMLSQWSNEQRQTFVSFDVDSIQGSDMPGVSCPSPIGFTANEATRMCYDAGREAAVSLVDFSELNVKIEDDRSPRLLCLMIYHFLLGVATRGGPGLSFPALSAMY